MLLTVATLVGRPCGRGTVPPRGSALHVLALCGCRLGCGFHRRLRSGTLKGRNGNVAGNRANERKPHGLRARLNCPQPTAWPFILAFGFTLLFAGLLTNLSVSMLGAVVSLAGCIGWFREVFPYEHEEVVPVVPEDTRVTSERRVVERLPVAAYQLRAWLPVHTYPVSAGVKGGLAGSVAMAVLACAYGLLKTGSIWYPINLLAAVLYAESLRLGTRHSSIRFMRPVSRLPWFYTASCRL